MYMEDQRHCAVKSYQSCNLYGGAHSSLCSAVAQLLSVRLRCRTFVSDSIPTTLGRANFVWYFLIE